MNEIEITVTYFTQTPDACVDLYSAYNSAALKSRQFEWTACGYYNYATEPDLVDGLLSEDNLPVPTSEGKVLTNRGIIKDNFARWFTEVPNLSEKRETTLKYNQTTKSFELETKPTDLYTLKTEFIATGAGDITITADDDTWVFVNNRLVLDLGGIHDPVTARLSLRENGEVYSGKTDLAFSGVKITDAAIIRIFHANRDSGTKPFFELSFADSLTITPGATTNAEGYTDPLGETLSVLPTYRQTIVNNLLAESIAVALLALLAVAIFWARKYLRLGRNRG